MRSSLSRMDAHGRNPRRPRAARETGDRLGEVIALTDLGVIGLNEGDPQRGVNFLEQALALSAAKSTTRTGNSISWAIWAWLLLRFDSHREPTTSSSTSLPMPAQKGDPFAEKLALERLALAYGNLGDPNRAIATCEQALAVTRRVGDRHQEANVLWHESIQFAELGQRDLAIAKAEEAITLFKLLGKPQAAWYGSYLQKYRMGQVDDQLADAPGGGAGFSPHSYLGGSVVANAMAPQPTKSGAAPAQGPGFTPHGDVGHQGDGQFRWLRIQNGDSRSATAASPDLCGLRAPYRPAMPDLWLLYQRQEPHAARGLSRSASGRRDPDRLSAQG